jgi:hypothetical protein
LHALSVRAAPHPRETLAKLLRQLRLTSKGPSKAAFDRISIPQEALQGITDVVLPSSKSLECWQTVLVTS